jgi:hypothetical protein
MGYTTDFEGQFRVEPTLRNDHRVYLNTFSETRRMKRDPKEAEKLSDKIRESVGLPIGVDGEYFVGGKGNFGQGTDDSIRNYNDSPVTQPGLWCHWTPSQDGTAIEWDGGEKFYEYVDWLQYIIDNFMKRWGYVLNGEVRWQGEDHSDMGKIIVVDNEITTKKGYVRYR